MKKLFILLLLALGINSTAQDLITRKNGQDVKVKIIEVGVSEVKYKRAENPNGPTYTVSKEEILLIKYENGQKEIFHSDSIGIESISKNEVSSSNYVVTERDGFDQDILPIETGEITWYGHVNINGLSINDMSTKLTQWGNQKGFVLSQKRNDSGVILFSGTFKISKGKGREYLCNNSICFYVGSGGYKYEIKNVYLTRQTLEFLYYNHDKKLVKNLETAFKNINTEMIKLGKEIQMIF